MKLFIAITIIVAISYMLINEITILVIDRKENGKLLEAFNEHISEWADGSRTKAVAYTAFAMLWMSVMTIPVIIKTGMN